MTTHSKKILIVEDEEGVRESLKLILGDHYPLLIAENGPQGLEVLENAMDDIGLVLLDIKMPQMNGLEVLKAVKARKAGLNAIMITGYKSVETASEAVNTGACAYIVKPFESKEILETVARFYQG